MAAHRPDVDAGEAGEAGLVAPPAMALGLSTQQHATTLTNGGISRERPLIPPGGLQ